MDRIGPFPLALVLLLLLLLLFVTMTNVWKDELLVDEFGEWPICEPAN